MAVEVKFLPSESPSRENFNKKFAEILSAIPEIPEIPETSGVTAQLLWKNASPTSEFAAQTIALDLTGYDGVLILPNHNTEENYDVVAPVYIPAGNGNRCVLTTFWRNFMRRQVTAVTQSGITFDDAVLVGKYADISSDSVLNSTLIPRCIYGVKGVEA